MKIKTINNANNDFLCSSARYRSKHNTDNIKAKICPKTSIKRCLVSMDADTFYLFITYPPKIHNNIYNKHYTIYVVNKTIENKKIGR